MVNDEENISQITQISTGNQSASIREICENKKLNRIVVAEVCDARKAK